MVPRRPARATAHRSAQPFNAVIEPRAVNEYCIVGGERDGPADCSGGNPETCVLEPLMQRVAVQSAVVAPVRHLLDRLFIDGH